MLKIKCHDGCRKKVNGNESKEKELTAYHEAGHALVGIFTPYNDPLHKVTIIPRGRALGVTMNLPERDRYSETKTEMKAKLAMMFGGRVAEEIILVKRMLLLGHLTTYFKQHKRPELWSLNGV